MQQWYLERLINICSIGPNFIGLGMLHWHTPSGTPLMPLFAIIDFLSQFRRISILLKLQQPCLTPKYNLRSRNEQADH